MEALAELIAQRDKLWAAVKGLPGVVTIGIGSRLNRRALVLFVNEKEVEKAALPKVYGNFPVLVEPARQAKAHGV